MRAAALALLLLFSVGPAACSRDDDAALAVEVAGKTRALGMAELAALPGASVEYKDHRYTGARLRDVLGATDKPVQATGADGYAKTIAPEVLGRDDALLAWQVDGAALPAADGPLRLVIPGSPGLSIKRVVKLGPP